MCPPEAGMFDSLCAASVPRNACSYWTLSMRSNLRQAIGGETTTWSGAVQKSMQSASQGVVTCPRNWGLCRSGCAQHCVAGRGLLVIEADTADTFELWSYPATFPLTIYFQTRSLVTEKRPIASRSKASSLVCIDCAVGRQFKRLVRRRCGRFGRTQD